MTPRFLQVQGVADVVPFGGLIKQYQVEIDPLALTKYGLSVGQIAQAVDANNQNAGGALLDNRQQAMVIRGVGMVKSIADIETIVVAETKGVPVFVRDVAHVKIGSAPPTGIFGVNEKRNGVEGIVLMRRGENPTEVLQGIKEAVDDLNTTRLPRGVELKAIYDRTELVNNTLGTVSHTLLEGLIIVIAVLFLFLGSVRAALLTAVTIPLSLLFAFLCMHFTGIPANLLSLGALDFGIIVDGTLVMVEHIVHMLDERHKHSGASQRPQRVIDTIRDAALEMERPIFFSLLIIISAYLPLFTLERVERRLFTPMAFTICFALLGSLLIGLDAYSGAGDIPVPARRKELGESRVEMVGRGYQNALDATMARPKLTVGLSLIVVVASFVLVTRPRLRVPAPTG